MNQDNNDGISCTNSAFKHGISEDDIRHAVRCRLYEKPLNPNNDDKFLIIGYDRNLNLLEIIYRDVDQNTINVFHAMKCRKTYKAFIRPKGVRL